MLARIGPARGKIGAWEWRAGMDASIDWAAVPGMELVLAEPSVEDNRWCLRGTVILGVAAWDASLSLVVSVGEAGKKVKGLGIRSTGK